MSLSKAKKKRLQAIRAGKLDPAALRLDWNGLSSFTRMTPTKQETLVRQQHKHKKKWNPGLGSEDSILFWANHINRDTFPARRVSGESHGL